MRSRPRVRQSRYMHETLATLHPEEEVTVRKVKIGEVTIDAVIEREGPWRRPQDFFPAYDEATFKRHLQVMEPEVFDPVSGKMFITYQTFVVRTPRHTILVDTCTGEEKGHPPPFDFPGKERWRNELFALGAATIRLITCFARTCISTTQVGIRPCATGAGCRRFRMRRTCSTRGNTRLGRLSTHGAPILPAQCSVITACRSYKQARRCSWMMTMLWTITSR